MFSSPPSQTTRGYTDQEMMDSVCQVNLNARVYDPTIGRIVTPDPVVPNPFNGQSFNRFSYVDNMSLSATDPSGYACQSQSGGGHGATSCNPHWTDPACLGCDTINDTNAGAFLSIGGGLGNYLADESVGGGNPGFCVSGGGCSPGVSTEFTNGTSLSGGYLYSYGPGIDINYTSATSESVISICQCYWVDNFGASPFGNYDTNGGSWGNINWGDAFSKFIPVNDHFTSVMGCFGVCLGYSWTKNGQAYLEVGVGTPQAGISREWTNNASNILAGPAINVNYSLVTSSLSLGSPYPASGGVTLGSVDLSGGASATYGISLGTTQDVGSFIGNILEHTNPNAMPIGP